MIFTEAQKIAKKYDHHISVEANAGSGKTAILVERYIDIILNEPKVKVHNVLGITFTDKAANELKSRIFKRLSEIINQENTPRSRRARIILERMSSLQISTIHGFCVNILKEFPTEANLDSNFSIIDDIDKNILIESSIDETMRNILENKKETHLIEVLKPLLQMYGTKKVKNFLNIFLNKREQIIVLKERLFTKSKDEIINHWIETIKDFTKEIIEHSGLIETLAKFKDLDAKTISLINLYNSVNDFNDRCAAFLEIYKTLFAQNGKPKKTFVKLNKEIIGLEETLIKLNKKINYIPESLKFIEFFSVKNIEISDIDFHIEIINKYLQIFDIILQAYQRQKDINSQLDFDDLILKVRELLGNEKVKSVLNERIIYIMIDEYQDTNIVQFDIISCLQENLTKGNLFIVGDPKQSIYSFRDAEVKNFKVTTERIIEFNKNLLKHEKSDKEDGKIILNESFRLLSDIVVFTNYLFENLMLRNSFEDIEYTPLIMSRNNSEPGGIECLFVPANNENISEEELIALKIKKIICSNTIIFETNTENARKAEYGDIAILLRSRTNLKSLENALIKHDIPFIVSGGTGYYQTQEIYDIFNYLKFLLNNEDDIALTGLLRSPFFMISDVDLYRIATDQNGKIGFWEKVRNFSMKNNSNQKIKNIVKILSEDIAVSKRISIPVLINRIISRTKWMGISAGQKGGEQYIANMDKFLNMARDFENKGFNTLFDFLERLRLLISEEEKEGQAVIDPTNQMVKIMTIHSAKGLEFPIVFLPHLHRLFKVDSEPYIDSEFGIGFEIPDINNYESEKRITILTQYIKTINKIKYISEEKRVFYVGVTRAHNRLILSGKYEPFSNKKSYLNWVRDVFELDKFILCTNDVNDEDSGEKTCSLQSGIIDLKYPLISSKIINGEFIRSENKDYNLKINVMTNKNELSDLSFLSGEQDIVKEIPKILLTKIPQKLRGNYFSATLIQTYLQCPLKYFIKYSLGMQDNIGYKKKNLWEFDKDKQIDLYPDQIKRINSIENDMDYSSLDPDNFLELDNTYILPGLIKGKILHKIFEQIDKISAFSSNAKEIIDKSFKEYYFNPDKIGDSIKNQILDIIINFLNSRSWKIIKNYDKYFCEYEISSIFKENYLIGTIDRLCIGENILIVDYKTEKIENKNEKELENEYKNQMLFYSYLARKLFPEKKVGYLLVYLEKPDLLKVTMVKEETISMFENVLDNAITNINLIEVNPRNIGKNYEHCSFCEYFNNRKCILN